MDTQTIDSTSLEAPGKLVLRTSDKLGLQVYQMGQPGRTPVVICNAAGMPIDLLVPLMRRLSNHFPVYSWDCRLLPGGPSQHDDIDLSVDRHIQDALDVCGLALSGGGHQRVHLIGWCTGARVASTMVADGKVAVKSLTLLNGSFADDELPRTAFEKNMRRIVPKMAANERTAEMFRKLMFSSQSGEAEKDVANFGTNNASASAKDFASLPYHSAEHLYRYARILNGFHTNSNHRLPRDEYTTTLVLTGDADETTHPEASQLIATDIGGARFESIQGGNHFMMYERPEVGAKVLEFMKLND